MHKVWDPSIRIVHWLILILVVALWATAEFGDADTMYIHQYMGFALFTLVVYRIIWGFVGPKNARFSTFVRGPQGVINYLKNSHQHFDSHNPLGGLAVVVLLVTLLAQVVSGFFTSEGFMDGPFYYLFEFEANDIHESIFGVLRFLIVLHILAVVYHQKFRKEPLVQAMVHGKKPGEGADENYLLVRALLVFAIVVVFTQSLIWLVGKVSLPLF